MVSGCERSGENTQIAAPSSSNLQLHKEGAEREGHPDSDGVCQAGWRVGDMVQIPWPKKAQLLRLPRGVFMDVSPFMTLLQRGGYRCPAGCRRTGSLQGGRSGQHALHPWLVVRNPVSLIETPRGPDSCQVSFSSFFKICFLSVVTSLGAHRAGQELTCSRKNAPQRAVITVCGHHTVIMWCNYIKCIISTIHYNYNRATDIHTPTLISSHTWIRRVVVYSSRPDKQS